MLLHSVSQPKIELLKGEEKQRALDWQRNAFMRGPSFTDLHCSFQQNVVKQLASWDQFHDHEDAVTRGHDLLEIYNVGMVQMLQNVYLALDLLLHAGFLEPSFVEDLNAQSSKLHNLSMSKHRTKFDLIVKQVCESQAPSVAESFGYF